MTCKDFENEFICLKALAVMEHKSNRTDLFVNVLNKNGKTFAEIVKAAEEKGLLEEKNPLWIGTRNELKAYMGGCGNCSDTCKRLGFDKALLSHMCTSCRFGDNNANDHIEEEKDIMAAVYNDVLPLSESGDVGRLCKAQKNYFFYNGGRIECLSVTFAASFCRIMAEKAISFAHDEKKDASELAFRMISRKKCFKTLSDTEKQEIHNDLSGFLEEILQRKVSIDAAQKAFSSLTVMPRKRPVAKMTDEERNYPEFTDYNESSFAIHSDDEDKGLLPNESKPYNSREITLAELTSQFNSSGEALPVKKAKESEGKKEEQSILPGQNDDTNKEPENLKSDETNSECHIKGPEVKSEGTEFDPATGIILKGGSGKEKIRKIKNTDLRRLFDIISRSRFISLDAVSLNGEEGLLLFEKKLFPCPVFISSEYYDAVLFRDLLNSQSYTALTMNLELLMEKARRFGIVRADYVYSLRSAYKTIEPADNQLYPVSGICSLMCTGYKDYVEDLFEKYEEIFGRIHFRILEKKDDKVRKTIQNYEMILASANDFNRLLVSKNRNLNRKDFIRNGFSYHRGIKKRAGGSVVKIENRQTGKRVYNNENFNRVLLSKIFLNENFRSMDLALLNMDEDGFSIFINTQNRQELEIFQSFLTASSLSVHKLFCREGILESYIEIE